MRCGCAAPRDRKPSAPSCRRPRSAGPGRTDTSPRRSGSAEPVRHRAPRPGASDRPSDRAPATTRRSVRQAPGWASRGAAGPPGEAVPSGNRVPPTPARRQASGASRLRSRAPGPGRPTRSRAPACRRCDRRGSEHPGRCRQHCRARAPPSPPSPRRRPVDESQERPVQRSFDLDDVDRGQRRRLGFRSQGRCHRRRDHADEQGEPERRTHAHGRCHRTDRLGVSSPRSPCAPRRRLPIGSQRVRSPTGGHTNRSRSCCSCR